MANQSYHSKSLQRFLGAIEEDTSLGKALTHHERLPANPPRFAEPEVALPISVQSALAEFKINSLYCHQVEALEAVRAGRNVVAVTPTASGKSLLYNLPVLEQLSKEGGHALYVFPLKALENDQASKLRHLIEAAGLGNNIDVGIYDGDTPAGERSKIRAKPPSILISNPDMLNLGMLAHHSAWETFFAGLKFVVIDELHVYRGVFGSHILHVLRRLNRICSHYGSKPQYIGTSATIAGAKELAEELTGLPFHLIERSGAPTPQRHFLFFNPVESYLTFALKLLVEALKSNLKVIVFTKARRTTELLHRWLNEAFREYAGKVSSYRAGFLPEERREIERKLLSGEMQGVISTSALELGIDIGGLDLCILVGYPGTIATTWQRAGRVGRGNLPAAICLVAGQDQLDQYFIRNPGDFFVRPVERAIVDVTNEYIARPHIISAAQEIPINSTDLLMLDPRTRSVIEALESEGQLLQSASGGEWFSALKRPQRRIDIRAAGNSYTIEIENKGGILGVTSGRSALSECHPGAMYLHRSEQFLVTNLDLEAKKVTVRRSDVAYYTVPLFEKETEILEEKASTELLQGKVSLVKLKVTEQLVGYQRRRTHTQELISAHDLDFAPTSYNTIGLAIAVPEGAQRLSSAEGLHFRGGIHGMEHAMLALAPLFALCDRNDLGGYSQAMHPQIKGPAIFLYDGHPGGIGLSTRLYEVFDELFRRTHLLVSGCPCETGCPSCIHSPKCGHGNVPLDKRAAVLTFEVLMGRIDIPVCLPTLTDRNVYPPDHNMTDRNVRPPLIIESRRIPSRPLLPPPSPSVKVPQAWPEGKTGVVFDLETQLGADQVGGWSNISKMKLAFASVYRFPTGEWLDFWEEDVERLKSVLRDADLVIGFNQVRFDYEVLRGYGGFDENTVQSYDILVEVNRVLGHRLNLNALASGTLGATKSADGLQSLEWWRKGEIEKVAVYCRQDVEVTRDLFFHILEKGYLLFEKKGIGLMRVPVKFKI